jgi:hypothetical protein
MTKAARSVALPLIVLIALAIMPQSLVAGTREDAKKSVVMLRTPAGFGAGILLGYYLDSVYIATANHVVRRADGNLVGTVEATFEPLPANIWTTAEVLPQRDRYWDLAVLRVADIAPLGLEIDDLRFGPVADPEQVAVGDGVYHVGYPEGREWRVNPAPDHLSEIDILNFHFPSLTAAVGNSGGGLFDADWNLIGMVTQDRHGDIVALRADRILEKFESWDYPLQMSLADPAGGVADAWEASMLSSRSFHVWKYPQSSASFVSVTHYGFRVGVSHTEDLPPAGESISIFSFDISDLPNRRIRMAELDLSPDETIGDPYGTLGVLGIEQISFGDSSQVLSAPAITNTNSHFLLDPPSEPLDITHNVKFAIERNATTVQFRIDFGSVGLHNIDAALAAPDAYLYWRYGPQLKIYFDE